MGGRRRERRREEREDAAFKDLGRRAEETDWAIGGGDERRLAGFRNGNYMGLLPDGRNLRVTDGEVKDCG